MSNRARKAVKLLAPTTYTANQTAAKGDWVRITEIRPPFIVVLKTKNGGATAPTTPSINVDAEFGVGKENDADADIFPTGTPNDVVGPTISAVGDKAAMGTSLATQGGIFARANIDISFTTPADGTTVEAWLVGNAT